MSQQAAYWTDFANSPENEFVLNARLQLQFLREVPEFDLHLLDIEYVRDRNLPDMGDMRSVKFDVPVLNVDFSFGEEGGDGLQNTGVVITGEGDHIAFTGCCLDHAVEIIWHHGDIGFPCIEGFAHTFLHVGGRNFFWQGCGKHYGKVFGDNGLANAVDVSTEVCDCRCDIAQDTRAISNENRDNVSVVFIFHKGEKASEGKARSQWFRHVSGFCFLVLRMQIHLTVVGIRRTVEHFTEQFGFLDFCGIGGQLHVEQFCEFIFE